MSPDEILDQIDHALHDWEVGPDAMRWSPAEPPPGTPDGRGAFPDLVMIDETHVWVRPPTDLRPYIDVVDQVVRESVANLHARRPADHYSITPGTQVVLGFDGARTGEDDGLVVALLEDAEPRLVRIWLNDWVPHTRQGCSIEPAVIDDNRPGEGAR